jgi:predicted GTPase
MPFGAGWVAARHEGASNVVDPRPFAAGSIVGVFERFPQLGPVLPAMGYGAEQLADLEATIRAVPCDVVVTGTPIDLGRIIDVGRPVRHAAYASREVSGPRLRDVLEPVISEALRRRSSRSSGG